MKSLHNFLIKNHIKPTSKKFTADELFGLSFVYGEYNIPNEKDALRNLRLLSDTLYKRIVKSLNACFNSDIDSSTRNDENLLKIIKGLSQKDIDYIDELIKNFNK